MMKKRKANMTQDERWSIRYDGVMEFITTTHRNPSCHRLEEHGMLNWVKANRKKMNAGELQEERLGKFVKLLEMGGCIG